MTTASEHAWFNGRIVEREAAAPSVASISFHMGTGVFDGMMAYWNEDHFHHHRAMEHLIRFADNAAAMGLPFTWTPEDLMDGIARLVDLGGSTTQYVRPIAFRAAPELWLTGAEGRPVDVAIFTVPVPRDSDLALACHYSPVERVSGRAMPVIRKVCGCYVNSFLARRAAEQAGFQDALMLDRSGAVTEASAANVFFIDRDGLLTPKLSPEIFPGITRATIMEIAARLGISCREDVLRAPDVEAATGAFLCSTLMEVRPISRVGSRALSLETDVFVALRDEFRRCTHL